MKDQRQAAVAQAERIAQRLAELIGVPLEIHQPGDRRFPSASQRVLDQWVASINGPGPRGLCKNLHEAQGPQPSGGFPFIPGGLFCWECILSVMQILNSPECPGPLHCPGCGLEAPLFWGSTTIGMHTLMFGLCRACEAEDDYSTEIGHE